MLAPRSLVETMTLLRRCSWGRLSLRTRMPLTTLMFDMLREWWLWMGIEAL
jgi:hypothetical protein